MTHQDDIVVIVEYMATGEGAGPSFDEDGALDPRGFIALTPESCLSEFAALIDEVETYAAPIHHGRIGVWRRVRRACDLPGPLFSWEWLGQP